MFTIRYLDNYVFLAESDDGRLIIVDGRRKEEKKYFSPMELLLIAAATCSAIDIVSILRKMRKNFRSLRVEIDGRRRDDYPKIYERVKMRYIVEGDVDRESVEKAVKLSLDKYCSASITLMKAGADFTYEIVVNADGE